MFYAPAALGAGTVDIELEIFGSESLIPALGEGFQQNRVLDFLYFSAFGAHEVLMIGGSGIDYFFKLRGFVAKPVPTHNPGLGEKLYGVVYSSAADAKVGIGHSPADSLDVEMSVHPEHHVENGVSLGGAAEVFSSEIPVKSVNSRCFYFVVSHINDKGNKFFISRKNNARREWKNCSGRRVEARPDNYNRTTNKSAL